MNKNVSLGGLIDLKKLNALIEKADTLIVGTDADMTYICNSHWIVRVRLAPTASTRGEIFKRLGAWPEDGKALSSRGGGKATDYSLDNLKSFVADTFYANCYDTRMSQEISDGRDLRVFDCEDQGSHCYIAIDRTYFSMIDSYYRAAAKECKKNQPILFTGNYDEFAFILAVGNFDMPYLK